MTETKEMNELYQSLSPAVREELSQRADETTVPAYTYLLRQDAIPEHLIIIMQGSVEISVPSGGQALCLRVAGVGKALGLQAIVTGTFPEIEARTLEDCRVLRIPRQWFLDVLKRRPEMYLAISKVLSGDLSAAERFLRQAPRSGGRARNISRAMAHAR